MGMRFWVFKMVFDVQKNQKFLVSPLIMHDVFPGAISNQLSLVQNQSGLQLAFNDRLGSGVEAGATTPFQAGRRTPFARNRHTNG